MATRARSVEAELLLPLAAGLALLAVSYATTDGAWTGVLNLITLLALGAIVPENAWRTGAFAASPGVFAAVLAAANRSMGTLAGIVVLSPLVLVAAGLLVKGGALLVIRHWRLQWPDPRMRPPMNSTVPLASTVGDPSRPRPSEAGSW